MRSWITLLLIVFYLISCVDSKKRRKSSSNIHVVDDLLKATLIHDVLRVKELLQLDQSELSSRAPILVNRVEENYGRTSVMVCGSDPQKERIQDIDSDCQEIVKSLHAAGAYLNVSDSAGWDALAHATHRGFDQVTKYLLESHEVDINHQDLLNRTSLMKSIIHGHYSTFQLLINHGARLDLQDSNGLYAIHYAVLAAIKSSNNLSIFKYALELHQASELESWVDDNGRTALMFAAIANDLQLVDLILNHITNIRKTDFFGLSAAELTSSSEVKARLTEAYLEEVDKTHSAWLKARQSQLQEEVLSLGANADLTDVIVSEGSTGNSEEF